jgi:glutamine amidotransferase
MCRWLGYTGNPILLETLLFKPEHSLIDQSMASHSKETPTNGDGFGVGWYDGRGRAGLFRSTRPAWNDFNLREVCAVMESKLFLAHVRATSQASVEETNCHPFRHGKWLFVHNGEIDQIEKIRRDLLFAVSPALFPEILGTTDSETMFYLALTFGLERDPLGALERMAGFVEEVGRRHGVTEALWATFGVSDGETLWGVRYSSAEDPPTLYHSRDMSDLYAINPAVEGILSPDARVVVSEPVGRFAEAWVAVEPNTAMILRGGKVEKRPFRPQAASAAAGG